MISSEQANISPDFKAVHCSWLVFSIAIIVTALSFAPAFAQDSSQDKQLTDAWTKLKPIARKSKRTAADLAGVMSVIKTADGVIAKNPNSYKWYLIRGEAMILFGRVNAQAVLRDVDKAIAIAPKDGEAYHLRGRAYRSIGRNQDAVKNWSKAAKELKSSDSALALGGYYMDCRDYKQAVSWDTLATELSPKDPLTYYFLSICQMAQLEYARAAESMTKSIALTAPPKTADQKLDLAWKYHLLSEFHVNLGQNDKAINALNAELAITPGNPGERLFRAKVHRMVGNDKKALDDLAIAIPSGGFYGKESLIMRAKIYRKMNRLDEAVKDCTAAIKLVDKEPEGYQLRGECLADKKQFGAAIADMNEASRRERVSHIALSKKAKIQEQMGDKVGATKTLAEINDLNDDLAPSTHLGK